MKTRLHRVVRRFSWYLRQVTGEAKWDDYVEECRRSGNEPVARREFERHRDRHRELSAQSRCC